MADDIVDRLRDIAVMTDDNNHETLAWEAADEIERLRAAGDELARTCTLQHRDDCRCNTCVMARAWEEARRGHRE